MKPKYWNKGKIYLSNKDKVLKKLIQTYRNEYLNLNSNYFHSLINSIIGQQISVSAADSMKTKFFKLKRNITPQTVSKLSTADGDLGFLKAISKLYKVQLPISERKLKLLYKKWSPYSSQATWYLWRSLDPIPVNY